MPIEEQIKAVEDEIQKTPYNKATQHHIGRLKAKLARLKDEQETRRLKGGGGGPSYAVKKSGNATVGLVGFPSVGKSTLLNQITDALHLAGIRLNERPADVTLTKANRGGLTVNPTVKLTKLDSEMVADICREWGYLNGTVVVRQDITEDQLIDVLAGNRVFLRAFVVVNKIDLVSSDYVKQLQAKLPGWKLVPISAEKGVGLTRLKDEIYSTLRFMRVFLKPQGKEADMADPMIVKQDSDVGMVCDAIHRDWRKRFRYANVWGQSAQFPGQKVGLDHPLKDADVLTIVLRTG